MRMKTSPPAIRPSPTTPACPTLPRGRAGALAAAAFALAVGAASPARADSPDWTFAGRLGIVQYVIVPEAQARDRGYYDRIIEAQCGDASRCFLRFFTNSSKAEVSLPLPEAIGQEPTALFQRSDKRGGADFRWACRMKVSSGDCF